MATAREFLIIIRLHNEKGTEVFSYLDRIEKSLKEQGFSASRAGSEDIKRIMAVYYDLAMKYLRPTDESWRNFYADLQALFHKYNGSFDLSCMNFPSDWTTHLALDTKRHDFNSRPQRDLAIMVLEVVAYEHII